jgi:hypothetical protein
MLELKLDLTPHSVYFDNEHPCINFIYKGEKFCLLWTTMQCVSMFFDTSQNRKDVVQTIAKGCDKILSNTKESKNVYHTSYGIIEYGFHKQVL